MAGTPYWRESTPVISSSEIIPSFTSAAPMRPPFFFWCSRACVSCSWLRSFSLTRISPSRADTLSLRYGGSGEDPCAHRPSPPPPAPPKRGGGAGPPGGRGEFGFCGGSPPFGVARGGVGPPPYPRCVLR